MNRGISVIMPVYNGERYLKEAIDSVLAQGVNFPFDLVIIDDASTDGTNAIINSYVGRIKALGLEEHHGLGKAVNMGVRLASGDYVVRVDADDLVHFDFLEHLLIGMLSLKPPPDAVACNYQSFDNDGENPVGHVWLESPIACGVLWRRDSLIECGLYDEVNIYEDKRLMKQFKEKHMEMGYVFKPLYYYRQHAASLTAKRAV